MAVARTDETPPETYDALRAAIAGRHAGFSQRLRQIAEYALDNPDAVALETVAGIAEAAGVQPSALIRFAKALGFAGFSDMQRVFRERLTARSSDYGARLRAFDAAEDAGPAAALDHFARAGIEALGTLRTETRRDVLERAVTLLASAEVIHLMGQRRSFPVAAYLAYGFGHLGRRARLLDGMGGMARQQGAGIGPRDALLAVSFSPYAPETLDMARLARTAGASVVALTDGPLSPFHRLSSATLEVRETTVKGFRSLTASMCLATALVVALGRRLGDARPDGA